MGRAQTVRALGVEFVVVVLGVLVALAVDEFREARRDAGLAAFYLEALEADLVNDSLTLSDAATRSMEQSASAALLDSLVEHPGATVEPEALAGAIRDIGGMADPAFNDGTYRDLINSGNSRLIADPGLRRKINAYYSGVSTASSWDDQTFESFTTTMPPGLILSSYADTTSAIFRGFAGGEVPHASTWDSEEILASLRGDRAGSRDWLRRYELRMSVAAAYFVSLRSETLRLLGAVREGRSDGGRGSS